MPSCLRFDHLLAAVLGLALGFSLLLGPGAERSEAAQCGSAKTPAYKLSARKARSATLCMINKERSSRGLSPLHQHSRQQESASKHTRVMVSSRCFDHECPGERDLIGRIIASGYLPCLCTWGVGENIAWGGGRLSSPRKIVAAWMNSAPHRANILNRSFDEIGIGIDRGSPTGMKDAATYTTDFGYKR